MMSEALIASALEKLLRYCEENNWQGYDPYDGLNSRVFQSLPLTSGLRLFLTQLCKRSPINLRKILLVRKEYNPKALGLFLSSYVKLYSLFKEDKYKKLSAYFVKLLRQQYISGYSGHCWGYNFDWQSRTTFVPKGTPNVICTTFVANAFLDAYEVLRKKECLEIARSSCEFVLNDLNKVEENDRVCISYTPLDKTQVYNANFLAAALLARVYKSTGEDRLLKFATKIIRFCVERQNPDGSWYYSPLPWHKWVDNFHTGFNLVALNDYMDFVGTQEFKNVLGKGFIYYKRIFFLKDEIPKYYHNSLYPIDIHNVAQGIITFIKLKSLNGKDTSQALKIARWGIENMQGQRGFFYFQKHKFFNNKISYIRWSQAWMLYALCTLLSETTELPILRQG